MFLREKFWVLSFLPVWVTAPGVGGWGGGGVYAKVLSQLSYLL